MTIIPTKPLLIIPNDRPTLGRDLNLLREHFNCSVKHMLKVLGISSRNKWQELVDKKADLPVQDASLALLARYYDQHPDEFPDEHGYNIGDVMALLAEHDITTISASRLAVIIGRSKTVGPKYVNGTTPDPSAYISFGILYQLIKQNRLNDWLEIVNVEGVARGLMHDKNIADKCNNIQSWLTIDSWGGRNKTATPYEGTNRRSKSQVAQFPVLATKERRRLA